MTTAQTSKMSNPAPGFTQHIDHKIELVPLQPVEVKAGDELIAKSAAAISLLEASHSPVLYIPRDDILTQISKSDTSTYCPFKGQASYWNIEINGKVILDAAWSYDNPYDEMQAIKGHLAFYPDKAEIIQP